MGQLGVDCNNAGMQFAVGVSKQQLCDLMPEAETAADGRPYLLADTGAACNNHILETWLANKQPGLGLPLAKASVVHLADGGTALTGEPRGGCSTACRDTPQLLPCSLKQFRHQLRVTCQLSVCGVVNPAPKSCVRGPPLASAQCLRPMWWPTSPP